jgi:hypothetical protein
VCVTPSVTIESEQDAQDTTGRTSIRACYLARRAEFRRKIANFGNRLGRFSRPPPSTARPSLRVDNLAAIRRVRTGRAGHHRTHFNPSVLTSQTRSGRLWARIAYALIQASGEGHAPDDRSSTGVTTSSGVWCLTAKYLGHLNPFSTTERLAAAEYAAVKALIEDRNSTAGVLSPVCFLQRPYKQAGLVMRWPTRSLAFPRARRS